MIYPNHDLLLIEEIPFEVETSLFAGDATYQVAKVIARGPEVKNPDQTVIYQSNKAFSITVKGTSYLLLHEADVIATLEE